MTDPAFRDLCPSCHAYRLGIYETKRARHHPTIKALRRWLCLACGWRGHSLEILREGHLRRRYTPLPPPGHAPNRSKPRP